MVGMLKKFLGGKCARNKKLNITWVEIASQYCTFTLISSTGKELEECLKKTCNFSGRVLGSL